MIFAKFSVKLFFNIFFRRTKGFVEMKKSLARDVRKNAKLPAFMQQNNASRLNLEWINSKGLRENNFAKRDFFSPKTDFQSREEFLLSTRNGSKNWMRHTTTDKFRKTKKDKKPDSDDEDSLSELFHKHDL